MFISLNSLGSMVLDVNGNRLDATFLDRPAWYATTSRNLPQRRRGGDRAVGADKPEGCSPRHDPD